MNKMYIVYLDSFWLLAYTADRLVALQELRKYKDAVLYLLEDIRLIEIARKEWETWEK